MTVGELRKKLEFYKDDTEIFLGHYDDLHGDLNYYDPIIRQEEIDVHVSKKGNEYYAKWRGRAKKHTVLVIE